MSTEKKWIFNELVTDPDNVQQLLAYSMYKADKNEQANNCRAEGKTEEDIQKKLIEFQDTILRGSRLLDSYREKSQVMMDQLVEKVQENIIETYEEKLSELKLAHQKELNEKWDKWCKDAESYALHLNKPSYLAKFGAWLSRGLSSLVSTTLVTLIVLGIITYTHSPMRKTAHAVATSAVNKYVPDVDESNIPSTNGIPESAHSKNKNVISSETQPAQ